jgi:tRNA A37 methylthiotransferase MiaB
VKLLHLLQLPIPQPTALASTGNVPLSAGCLAVSARVHGLHAQGLSLSVASPDLTDTLGDSLLAEHVCKDEPDFVGLSLYLWNVERSLHLAREIKRRSPRTKVLIGGPEVSADNPFVLSQSGFDVAVTGEAEDTFALLMARLLEGREVTGMPGVSVRTPFGMGPFGPAPSANFALTQYPSPYLEGLVPVDPRRSTYVESVRGCRSHCTYCFYPRSSNVLRALDVQNTKDLIDAVRRRGAREVVFLDPTFNHRPDFELLLDALCEVNADKSLSFFGEVRAEGLTSAHAQALGRAGFTKLEIGLQSVNRETLKRVRRGGSPDKVAEAARMLRDQGIDLLVDLMIGLPGDTADDVARGVDFLIAHGIDAHAQVFPLSLLPGTAMRATAAQDGVTFDPAPPYRVRRTRTLDEDALQNALFDAEDRLGRRLDELPRPHLVRDAGLPRDVFRVNLDDGTGLSEARGAGARHAALWLHSKDPFAHRDVAQRAVELRLTADPYCSLDVIVYAREPFPLDLLDLLRGQLSRAPQSYASRSLAHRGEDLQRRVCVVLAEGHSFARDWVDAARNAAYVFREQSALEAAARATALGDELEGALILDRELDEELWQALCEDADPGAIAFAERALELRWVTRVLEPWS